MLAFNLVSRAISNLILRTVDLGGSLAVASRGLFATGVSTDLNVTYLSSGGKVGDLIKAEATCDKCQTLLSSIKLFPSLTHPYSRQNTCIHLDQLHKHQRRSVCPWKSHKVCSLGVERPKQHRRRAITKKGREEGIAKTLQSSQLLHSIMHACSSHLL